MKVTVTGDKTLREALDEISIQCHWPRLEWALCQGFGNTLFSISVAGQGIDYFPLRTRSTGLM